MFHRQSRSRMIAKRIPNSRASASWKVLFSKRKYFSWQSTQGTVSYDGTTMLYLIISAVKPSTRVGVSDLRVNTRQACLVQFQFNVPDLCDKSMSDFQSILYRNKTHDNIVLGLFGALLSGKNEVFTRFVQRRKDDWETGGRPVGPILPKRWLKLVFRNTITYSCSRPGSRRMVKTRRLSP